jgi:hypothetical protein
MVPPPIGTAYAPGMLDATCTSLNPAAQVVIPVADPSDDVAALAANGENTIASSAIDDVISPARAIGRNAPTPLELMTVHLRAPP